MSQLTPIQRFTVLVLAIGLAGCAAGVVSSAGVVPAPGTGTARPVDGARDRSPTAGSTDLPTPVVSLLPDPSAVVSPTPLPTPTPTSEPQCPAQPYTVMGIVGVPDGWSATSAGSWSAAAARRAACLGGEEIRFFAIAFTPATTVVASTLPSGFRTQIAFVGGLGPGDMSLEAWIGDGAIAPGDRSLVGNSGGCAPTTCDRVWWDVRGHFDAAVSSQCRAPGPYAQLVLSAADAVEYCRNTLFVDTMRVALERHVATSGETLSGIAGAAGITLAALVEANPQVTATSVVSAGDVISIRSTVGSCDVAPQPSAFAGLDLATKLGCFGAATVSFDAQLWCLQADVDWVPFEVPSIFQPVYVGRNPACIAVIADSGPAEPDFVKSIPVRLASPSMLVSSMTGTILVHIAGHFDDTASRDCRRPVSVGDYLDVTDDSAIESCQAEFIVSSLSARG